MTKFTHSDPVTQQVMAIAARKAAQRRRVMRRIGSGAAIGLAVLLAVFFLIPFWISTERGRVFALRQLSHDLNGSLTCADWNVGWFTGTEFHDLTISTPDGHAVVTCRTIRTELPLWSLLRGDFSLGDAVLDGLVIDATLQPDGTSDAGLIFSRWRRQWRQEAGAFSGLIDIRDARITLHPAGIGPPLEIDNVSTKIPIASLTAPIHVDLTGTCVLNTQRAPLTAALNAGPLAEWDRGYSWSVTDFDIQAGQLPTTTLAQWLGADPRWDDAFGGYLASCEWQTHRGDQGSTVVQAIINGSVGSADCRLLMQSQDDGVWISLPNNSAFHARATLRMADPVRRALAWINPVFAAAVPKLGTVTLSVAEARLLPADLGTASSGTAQLSMTEIALQRTGLMAAILSQARVAGENDVKAIVSPMRVTLNNGSITAEPMSIGIGGGTFTFSGAVNVNGPVDLKVALPLGDGLATSSLLGSDSAVIPITGTVADPMLSAR
jgi:hypothetical protein